MSNLPWQERLSQVDPTLRIHLVGIGGAGLSAVAQVLLEMHLRVSGSDRQPGATTQRLAAAGATVFPAQEATNLTALPEAARPDVVLISSAVDAANPERRAAEELGIAVVKRDEFLPALLAERRLIAVAGTHGKTTTTAMTLQALRAGRVDCGYIVGTDVPGFGSGAAGSAPDFVLEADEYDRMFLGLRPSVAVVTNVEWDHPDCYPTPASFRRAFMQFTDAVDRNGIVISCADDTGAEQVRTYAAKRGPRWITYGLAAHADLRAVNLRALPNEGTRADLVWWHAPAGELLLHVPGVHNVRNALAALAVATALDVPMPVALGALAEYRGATRRFEWKGEAGGVTVIDDYAHHPTEIQATLAAARSRYPDRRIWAIFQPHTFSRTRHMLYRMGESFEQADEVIVTDIYAAREVDDGSVSARELVAASPHPAIRYIGALAETVDYLDTHLQPGDVVITLGAGDGNLVGERVLAHRQDSAPGPRDEEPRSS
jgi:UDP-N-acetylmuramate--alanine ligase